MPTSPKTRGAEEVTQGEIEGTRLEPDHGPRQQDQDVGAGQEDL